MKLHFLGGADEVGASCLLVEAGGKRILVDAGVRMGSGAGDRLPDLARASDLGGLDAILVTHAHLDHTGALPLVHGAFPRAPVLMTPPTLGLLRILLLDALKIMEQQSEKEGEIPLYPLPAVESLLAKTTAVPFLDPVIVGADSAGAGGLRVTFFPAGHVLGAAAVGLETAEGNLLVTGDVSVTDQLTVPGMPRPRFAPDVMVCESTYGARLHASRRAEEERLSQDVLDVLRGGGKVLIPAFALGRAQEVLLILRKALAGADAPRGVVYYDGMVRAICGIYGQHADALSRTLRDRARKGRGLFDTADGRIRPVGSAAERETILAGDPCVIVASSGMLSGGPSQHYAAMLAGSESSLISITGYQDEEAPGRRLQELAAGSGDALILGGRRVPLRCRVSTYALSAHADAQELAGLTQSLGPRDVVLVHGDPEARRGLAAKLFDVGCRRVHLPAAGDVLTVEAPTGPRSADRDRARDRARSRGRGGDRGRPSLGGDRPFDGGALASLHRHLWANEPRGRTYAAADLAACWHGADAVPPDLAAVHAVLRGDQPFFVPDAKRPFLYRCVDPERADPTPSPGTARDEHGRLEQNAALARVDALLDPQSGLYKRGADRETWTLRINFHFPDVEGQRARDVLTTLAQETGWAVAVSPEPHLASLAQLALELLTSRYPPTRAPSIFKDERRVSVPVAELPAPDVIGEVGALFAARTGFSLHLECRDAPTPTAKQAFDSTGRMEINLAFATIDRAFADQSHRPSRKSKKSDAEGPLIELTFITPEVGARYQTLIDDLAQQACWRIHVAPRVDQQSVLRHVGDLLPATWQVTKGPGLDVANRRVRLRLAAPPGQEERDAMSRALDQETGFTLDITIG